MKEFSRMIFGKKLIELAKDNDFLVMNADTKSCSLESFGNIYPERNFSIGIAEQNLVAAAAGAASCGEKVYLATFAVFAAMRACEQVRTFVCYPNMNVVVLASHAGLQTGADGATHIATEDVAIMRSLPNMTIIDPSDLVAAEKFAELSLKYNGPMYIRFPKTATEKLHDENNYDIEIGKGRVFVDYGTDASIIVSGWMLAKAAQAAEILKSEGIMIRVVEIHTIKPLDEACVLSAARECGAIVTVEDHSVIGGLGSAVCELLAQNCIVPVKVIGIKDQFAQSGDPEKLYAQNNMTVDDIVLAVKNVINRKKGNS